MTTIASRLAPLFDGNDQACENAARTARVILEGKNSIGNDYGLGIRVTMQTTRGCITKPNGSARWSASRSQVVGHSKQALMELLCPLGLTIFDFLKACPRPTFKQVVIVDFAKTVERVMEK